MWQRAQLRFAAISHKNAFHKYIKKSFSAKTERNSFETFLYFAHKFYVGLREQINLSKNGHVLKLKN